MANLKLGFHPIFRSILNHWVWQDKPFRNGQAWVDMILMANHGDHPIKLSNGKTMLIKKGELFRTRETLAKRWGWKKGKVTRFLNRLKDDGMISIENVFLSGQRRSIITLLNYNRLHDEASGKTTMERTMNRTENRTENRAKDGSYTKNVEKNDLLKELKKELKENNYTHNGNDVCSEDLNKFGLEDNIYNAKDIFDHWNQQSIITHTNIQEHISPISKALEFSNSADIKSAISNYAKVLKDSTYYYSHKYTLPNFLKSIDRFLPINFDSESYLDLNVKKNDIPIDEDFYDNNLDIQKGTYHDDAS
jgi:hypothetical protein